MLRFVNKDFGVWTILYARLLIIELFSLYHNYYHWRHGFTVCQKCV